MIINCSGCGARLQLDDAKIPARPFTLKCPKCQSLINAPLQASTANDALSVNKGSEVEAVEGAVRLESVMPAPAFNAEENNVARLSPNDGSGNMMAETKELARLLVSLLQRGAQSNENGRDAPRLDWERRRALVCVACESTRAATAELLARNDYQTFVADDVSQAIERMREERMDVLVLDPDFDSAEQGAAFVNNEVNMLRPAERRKVFLINLNAAARTGDAHAAFVNNVNLIINPSDIENLPRVLDRALRDYQDLYSDLNRAFKAAAL
jgi:predicted Zn finger-like uncharacterized protein